MQGAKETPCVLALKNGEQVLPGLHSIQLDTTTVDQS